MNAHQAARPPAPHGVPTRSRRDEEDRATHRGCPIGSDISVVPGGDVAVRDTYRVEPESTEGRRRWPIVITMLLLLPIFGLGGFAGSTVWCEHVGYDSHGIQTLADKEVSITVWPPGFRCAGDRPDGTQAVEYWPIGW